MQVLSHHLVKSSTSLLPYLLLIVFSSKMDGNNREKAFMQYLRTVTETLSADHMYFAETYFSNQFMIQTLLNSFMTSRKEPRVSLHQKTLICLRKKDLLFLVQ